MNRRPLAALCAALLLLLPALPATAAGDDPSPQSWPTIENPGTSGGSANDPKTVDWPEIAKPDNSSSNDPKPTEWPAPEPG
ncbi:hypothetical protein GCM10009554_24630 [Kribbella koreensis]|uniref:Uncharacterized protein n=1 Tax=Kribbella koreensis TaxID=57909 RepID=A0ABN1Q4E0_9ACTN